jgi:cardiolipin synthase
MSADKHKTDKFGVWHDRGTTYVRMPLVVAAAGVIVIALLTVLFWSVKRKPAVRLQVGDVGELKALTPSLTGLTQSSLEPGNAVEVLQNGEDFFPRILADIETATKSVHIETFIWEDGTIATRLVDLLAKKARSNVDVRVLVDASGGKDLDEEAEFLEKAGAAVVHFHPFRPRNLGRLNNRDHRKVIVIDGAIGYVGGHGIGDHWSGDAHSKQHYRDTALRITGPAVHQLQGGFAENWIEETGLIPADDEYFPHLDPAGTVPVHVVYTSPTGSIASVQILHYLALKAARREILIQNPYLLPDQAALEALGDAVRRGVRVRIMVPSANATDAPVVQHASHHSYGELLKRGVEIYEYEKTLLHQKVMVIDGIWSCVGSTNFDDRSFQLNDELSVGVLNEAIADELRAAFDDDLRHARRITLNEWAARSLWHKLIDAVASLGRSQL